VDFSLFYGKQDFMNHRLYLQKKAFLADTFTPVSLYYKLRDVFPGSLLLESSDYHGNENAKSFICCQPLSTFSVFNEQVKVVDPDGKKTLHVLQEGEEVLSGLRDFQRSFDIHKEDSADEVGLFGYVTFDAVRYFEDISLDINKRDIPDIHYALYQYVIEIDHFHNTCILNTLSRTEHDSADMDRMIQLVQGARFEQFSFTTVNDEVANMTDDYFLEMIDKGQSHCSRGDVFQVVLSRRYKQAFRGDDFNVYRALRSINPSPYLFYFDYGTYRLIGSSPEAQIRIQNREATIYPIAGTFRRTGNDMQDAELAAQLSADPKENAEHIMLVDLARNDLSKVCSNIEVKVFKEVQYYSHVIHLVSEVVGKLAADTDELELFTKTFPAGTLSGAPKYRAIQIIDDLEPDSRGFYGGAIGYMGLNGDINHAIMIRTFLSKENQLEYQSGAGVVAKSIPENELQEVHNKLGALRRAIEMAGKI